MCGPVDGKWIIVDLGYFDFLWSVAKYYFGGKGYLLSLVNPPIRTQFPTLSRSSFLSIIVPLYTVHVHVVTVQMYSPPIQIHFLYLLF